VELVCPALAPFVYSRHVDAQPHGSLQQLQREDAALREFVILRRAIRKPNGDRKRAIALVCRCFAVWDPDALLAQSVVLAREVTAGIRKRSVRNGYLRKYQTGPSAEAIPAIPLVVGTCRTYESATSAATKIAPDVRCTDIPTTSLGH